MQAINEFNRRASIFALVLVGSTIGREPIAACEQFGEQEPPVARAAAAPAPQAEAAPFETIKRALADGVAMTADLYRLPATADDKHPRPVLVCMHMTMSSRGEYRKLAPRILALGFNVLAVDLRCGGEGENGDRRTKKRFGVLNETWTSARKVMGREPEYPDAYPDVFSAVDWAHELFPESKIALLGSSYSASLALIYAAERPSKVDAVIALSPGEYIEGWSVADRVRKLKVPAYITCGNTDADVENAKPIAQAIEGRVSSFFPEDEHFIGDHGSRTLSIKDPVSRAKQWEMLEKALAPLL